MSANTADPRQCELIQEELAELALGALDGRSRSEALEHVASCPRCRATLEHLSGVTDTLLQLAPEVEPPLGFELRLVEKLNAANAASAASAASAAKPRATERARQRWYRRAGPLVAAAAVILLLGIGVGSLLMPRGAHNQQQSASPDLATAQLTSHGQVLGEVMTSPGNPAWMFMTINENAWSGTVRCEVTLAGGTTQTVGVFTLSHGYGAWGAPLTSPAGDVRSARLVAADGTVVASAQFPAH
jgi:negative regulator of sigma E activity